MNKLSVKVTVNSTGTRVMLEVSSRLIIKTPG